jgi:hypothetical protein
MAPNLLNDDGTASIATALMMSHHAFRRDLQRFAIALADANASNRPALREEWQRFRGGLHGHHEAEDNGVFPPLRAEIGAIIDELSAGHHQIDPLLERGDRAFAAEDVRAALEVIRELKTLLDPHLALEEERVIPFLRGAKGFPPPESDEMLAMYADGFAWSSYGIAGDVLERVNVIVPEGVRTRLPAAREAFKKRWIEVWGAVPEGASRTPVPDGY